MRLLRFLKSPTGNLVLFFGFIAVGGLLVYRSNAREKAQTAQMTRVETPESAPQREVITRNGLPLKLPAFTSGQPVVEAQMDEATRRVPGTKVAERPHVLPISLFASVEEKGPALSHTYAPYGRLIPCETVITLESSRIDTPLIGLVTEDVWHDGRLVIPAGAEVHGRASVDRVRERIAAAGKWVIVWRDGSPLNGTELVLTGIALDREKDDTTGDFGLRDGSAGLVGDLIKSDDWQEIKLFASTFLAGMASGLQQLQNQSTLVGLTQVPLASGRNAALQGTADVLNVYAKQIQETIARDGFFVRVPAGHQFYLYVTETIDQAKGTRGNAANEEIWSKNHETN